jgi:uncharacterized phage protein (TIGR01671 family)
MREIKFKVWDPEPGKEYMSTPLEIRDFSDSYYLHDDSVIFLQYTGLKDAHGNEIYEGDVISYKTEDNVFLTGEVRMRDGAFCVMGMIIAKMEFKLVYLHDIKVPVRIIGNGYEGMSSFRGGEE